MEENAFLWCVSIRKMSWSQVNPVQLIRWHWLSDRKEVNHLPCKAKGKTDYCPDIHEHDRQKPGRKFKLNARWMLELRGFFVQSRELRVSLLQDCSWARAPNPCTHAPACCEDMYQNKILWDHTTGSWLQNVLVIVSILVKLNRKYRYIKYNSLFSFYEPLVRISGVRTSKIQGRLTENACFFPYFHKIYLPSTSSLLLLDTEQTGD